MEEPNVIMNEFELYCDSLNEDCPVVLLDALELLKKAQREPVEPIRTVMTFTEFPAVGVNGVLIVGHCPVCGQVALNNADNKYCGGCGRKLKWKTLHPVAP